MSDEELDELLGDVYGMPKTCPLCGDEMEEVEDIPYSVTSGVPFPNDRVVESIWEAIRLKIVLLMCPTCGLLLVKKRK